MHVNMSRMYARMHIIHARMRKMHACMHKMHANTKGMPVGKGLMYDYKSGMPVCKDVECVITSGKIGRYKRNMRGLFCKIREFGGQRQEYLCYGRGGIKGDGLSVIRTLTDGLNQWNLRQKA